MIDKKRKGVEKGSSLYLTIGKGVKKGVKSIFDYWPTK